MPERVRLSRARGWRKPEGVVTVARPTRWGNPFGIGDPNPEQRPMTRAEVVELHRQWIAGQPELQEAVRRELRGRDLACWCPLDGPCHADELLRIANS